MQSIRNFLDGSNPLKVPTNKSKIEIEFGQIGDLGGTSSKSYRKVEVMLRVNGVATDRHRLILWENEAAGSRKVFRCLLDLRDVIF